MFIFGRLVRFCPPPESAFALPHSLLTRIVTDKFASVQKIRLRPFLVYLLCVIIAIGLMLLVWRYFGDRIKRIDETSLHNNKP